MDETDPEAVASGAKSPLTVLLAVQAEDLALDQLAYRRRELPERAELARLERETTQLEIRRQVVTGEWQRLTSLQAEIEQQVSGFDQRIASIEARMRQGGDYRDIQHMSDESASLARHRSELEDSELEVMEALEPVEAELAELTGAIESLGASRAETAERLAEAEAALDDELAAVSARRDEVAAGLPAELAATYDRLRERLGGVGAARLVDGSCSGCHLRLPSSERERVVHAAPDQLVFCDQCGRILVA